MKPTPVDPAAIVQPTPQAIELTGHWTARAAGAVEAQIAALRVPSGAAVRVDAAGIAALDSAGAWLLQRLLARLRDGGAAVDLQGLHADFAAVLQRVEARRAEQVAHPAPALPAEPGMLQRIGRSAVAAVEQGAAMLAFVGECAVSAAGCVAHPARIRWRPILFNIRSAGIDALPIVGALSFPLGVVIAYQGADQLRQYGANIFVADLVGLSMLREFAPLMTAIVIAGRSGSAYAAQIGTMQVTEEVDAMRTLGIAPIELLVLPKLVALMIALPLLTVFADVLGVLGGMVMARAQLGVTYGEFLDRFVKAVSPTAFLLGIGKAPVFALIIAGLGCFQGFRTRGGADSVGRQTTRAVVQSIFGVIVVDALFSVFFSALDL
ncbi:MlaE family lipid ABC transporter permease subunit [Ideonella sp. A 288]|uniref:ABC transporter permease n=1 Tax=Ideonella sp. A 288 TaxID=1962181 RepID=UPI000B4B9DBA|nr:MlaE family lipid ABC transporter permease subunit [Ideonella sp. A 288]